MDIHISGMNMFDPKVNFSILRVQGHLIISRNIYWGTYVKFKNPA